jgi:predicted RNA binding protein YcfA (HicA-like mRNA interferase family)
MPKLHSSRLIIAVLMKKGFIEIDQTGSQKKLRKDDRTVIVPSPRKEMPHGTFASILRQSGLNKDDFEK